MKHFSPPAILRPEEDKNILSEMPPPVPVSPDYDPGEARDYDGHAAADLAELAKDKDWPHKRSLRPGALARIKAAGLDMILALTTYMDVKKALRRLFKPLRPTKISPPLKPRKPRRKTIWQGFTPGEKEWAQLDAHHGYDVRGTSPKWVMRRASKLRAKMRRAVYPPVIAEILPSADTKTLPPRIREYQDDNDLHMIWPPIKLPELDEALDAIGEKPRDASISRLPVEIPAQGRDDALPVIPEFADANIRDLESISAMPKARAIPQHPQRTFKQTLLASTRGPP